MRISDRSSDVCSADLYYSIELKQGNGYPSPEETDVPGTVLGIAIGNISDLEASKGYFTDRVELNLQTAGGFDSYLVGRREYGSLADFLQIASVPATAATKSVSIVDNRGAPGIYYEYRSEEHTSELQSLMRISYAVFCLKKKKK